MKEIILVCIVTALMLNIGTILRTEYLVHRHELRLAESLRETEIMIEEHYGDALRRIRSGMPRESHQAGGN